MYSLVQVARIMRRTLLVVAVIACSQFAHAGKGLSLEGKITITPDLAAAGVERTIKIDGVWSNDCPPTTATLSANPVDAPSAVLIQLNLVPTLLPCAQVLTPFSVEVKFTPPKPGVLPVIASVSDGRFVADARLAVTVPGDPSALINVSGSWFELPNPASILVLDHSVRSNDAVVGSWNLFDAAGKPRWLLIHSSRRLSATTLDAALVEYTVPQPGIASGASPTSAVPCISHVCPVEGFVGLQIGTVRIETKSADQLVISAYAKGVNPDLLRAPLLFRSTMTRFRF
jgi:hypothetical protein